MLVSGGAHIPEGYTEIPEAHMSAVGHDLDVRTLAI